MSWKFDPERHSLASHGIKTTMSKLKDNKRKTLPKKWIKNRVDNHPHKAQMRKVAGEVYDKIQKGIEKGDIIETERSLIITKNKRKYELYFDGTIRFPTKDLLNNVPKKERTKYMEWKRGNVSYDDWKVYHLSKIFEPLKKWIDEEYDLEFNFFHDYGGHGGFTIGWLGKDWKGDKQGKDWANNYGIKWIQDYWVSEEDLEFQYFALKSYQKSKNKRDFKNKITDWTSDRLKQFSEEVYDHIGEAIKKGELEEISEEIKKRS